VHRLGVDPWKLDEHHELGRIDGAEGVHGRPETALRSETRSAPDLVEEILQLVP
jgi:hypothetical protein